MAHVKGVVGKITGQTKAWKKADKRSAEAAHEMAKRGKKQGTFLVILENHMVKAIEFQILNVIEKDGKKKKDLKAVGQIN